MGNKDVKAVETMLLGSDHDSTPTEMKRKKKRKRDDNVCSHTPSTHLSIKMPTLGNLKLRISGHVSKSTHTATMYIHSHYKSMMTSPIVKLHLSTLRVVVKHYDSSPLVFDNKEKCIVHAT